jgi:hypothetical protein
MELRWRQARTRLAALFPAGRAGVQVRPDHRWGQPPVPSASVSVQGRPAVLLLTVLLQAS